MTLNQKQFAAENDVTPKQIRAWYEKGYLPHATQNPSTNVYSIPDDTPVPFHDSNINRIKKLDTLMLKLLEAASNSNSVFASMFPLISVTDFDATIASLVTGGYIEEVRTQSGDLYLRLTPAGALMKHNLEPNIEKGHVSFMKCLENGITLADIAITIAQHPEWIAALMQLLH